jgi:hypothetical protein
MTVVETTIYDWHLIKRRVCFLLISTEEIETDDLDLNRSKRYPWSNLIHRSENRQLMVAIDSRWWDSSSNHRWCQQQAPRVGRWRESAKRVWWLLLIPDVMFICVIPDFMPKSYTYHMCAQDHLFHTHRHKVFIDNQTSRIKYIYYINNVLLRLRWLSWK